MKYPNRLIWNKGFTKPKPDMKTYDKTCNHCGKSILMVPVGRSFRPRDLTGGRHRCR